MEHLLAQVDYQMLAPIPQLAKTVTSNMADINTFVPNAIKLIIGIAGALAVIYIIVGGVQYMTTDAWGKKNDARGTISNAIIGLLLAIGAYAILNTLNPALVDFELKLKKIQTGSAIDPNTFNRPDIDSDSPSLVGCNDCARFPTTGDGRAFLNYKPVDAGGCKNEGQGSLCVVNQSLGDKLLELAIVLDSPSSIIESRQMAFQIIESYPPLRDDNTETCRQRGKPDSGECVYANVLNPRTNPINATWVEYFIRKAAAANMRAVYEVKTTARLNELINDDRLRGGKVILRPNAPIERFSIYNN